MSTPDRNFLSYADVDGRTIEAVRIDASDEGDDPLAFDDTLKLSHAVNFIGRQLWVRGGRENAVDMNRGCRNVRLEGCTLVAGRHCAVVIKGGSSDISLARVAIVEPVGAYDIELGGWSDQSFDLTRRVTLADVSRRDGQPVRVVVGRAELPAIVGGNCQVLFWRSLLLQAFWWLKYSARKVGLSSPPIVHP